MANIVYRNINLNMKRSESEDIDFSFYDDESFEKDSSDLEEGNSGVKSVEIKPVKKEDSTNEKTEWEIEKKERGLLNCIAYASSHSDGAESEAKTSSDSDITSSPDDSTLSSSTPSSDLTNVTPCSSPSSCSSGKCKNNSDSRDTSAKSRKSDMKFLTSTVEALRIQGTSSRVQSIFPSRNRRRNMTFTNEQLRKIDRENEILYKKIMAYKKPKVKSFSSEQSIPTVKSSSAVNRTKQQRKIEHDNYILLKKITSVKPTQSLCTNTKM